MNSAVMFSKKSDEWTTPQDLFDALNAEFAFDMDVAALRDTAKCVRYIGPDNPLAPDALDPSRYWGWPGAIVFCNPPYSKARAFVARAAQEAAERAVTTVMLLPSRTDTRWWHDHIWDEARHTFRPGVSARFLRGRLKFGGAENSAPFPSVVVIFQPEFTLSLDISS